MTIEWEWCCHDLECMKEIKVSQDVLVKILKSFSVFVYWCANFHFSRTAPSSSAALGLAIGGRPV